MELRTSTREVNGVIIISLEGKLRLGDETRQVRDTIRELLAEGRKNIVLDVEKLDYIDSSGLGTLIACYSSVSSSGGGLKLLRLTKRVREQLVMTKLLTVFEHFDDEGAAVASFGAAAKA